MVTGAAWTDIDKDGWEDLVVVGEWMPVTVFKNNKGSLSNVTHQLGLQNTSGLWQTIKAGDVNGDGRDDLLLGNLGENSKFHASENYPLKMFAGDISGNGFFDQVVAVEKNGYYYSFLNKEEMEKRFPVIMKKKFLDYSSYAGKKVDEVFTDGLKRTKELQVQTLSSLLLLNNGKGGYQKKPLPTQVQYYPVYAFITGDFNNDKRTDIFCAGNFTGVTPFEGFYDAGYGTVLTATEQDSFIAGGPLQSGITIKGEVRDIKPIRTIGGLQLYAVARNNDQIIFFRKKLPEKNKLLQIH